ncbi:MAG: hypothetical protein JNK85_22060 [Verrucomicrobiales bacterium]|nr:hypothetical protein [Verrucomicrobiales bacterium]
MATLVILQLTLAGVSASRGSDDGTTFAEARHNGSLSAEAYRRCVRYVDAWLAHADPATGLIPRNLRDGRDFWNGRDAGADNYAFMVLTAALTDRERLMPRMLEMLRTERRITARHGHLCDDYLFSRRTWRRETFDLDATLFDSAEYVKDGLLPITEWLGTSPWSDRAREIIDDIWKNARIATPAGPIATLNFEVNGDLLQACSRLHWLTGKRRYLDWAERLGDFYLLSTNHPTRHLERLRLRDHGGEVVNGLTELYVILRHQGLPKADQYRGPLTEILDRILRDGCNPDGLLYDWFEPGTGRHAASLADTWGYVMNGHYTVHLLDGAPAYQDAVVRALNALESGYTQYRWEGDSADGYADAIESALNLLNREPIDSAMRWVDTEIHSMWAKQQPDGIIEGWHGDGNFARTSLLYALWKTQGLTLEPWREDVRLGAVRSGNQVLISVLAEHPWSGHLVADRPRHRENLRLPLDYPRINQFPEWFTVEPSGSWILEGLPETASHIMDGRRLRRGIPLVLQPGRELRLILRPASSPAAPRRD